MLIHNTLIPGKQMSNRTQAATVPDPEAEIAVAAGTLLFSVQLRVR